MSTEQTTQNSLAVIKTEAILTDDEDLDCFGNHDRREVDTCGRCGLAEQCATITMQIKQEKSSFRPNFKEEVRSTKAKLKESTEVVALVKKAKTKQKEVEKTMALDKVKTKKIVKSPETEVKKVKAPDAEVKKVKKAEAPEGVKKLIKKSSGEKSEKGAGRPRTRETVAVIGETTFPVAFKTLHKGLEKIGTLNNKKSITTVTGDDVVFCSVSQIGRTSEKIEIFLNRSKEYTPKAGKHTEVKIEQKSGSSILVVTSSDKSQEEALEILTKWKKDQPKHLAEHGGKKAAKPKVEGGEKKVKKPSKEEAPSAGKKVVKKDKGEKTEAKPEAKPEKTEKGVKKAPPVVAPVKKKAPKVDDEEG